MWILGGDRYRPSEPHREGSGNTAIWKITLSNGLVVERKGKNSDLKVIDPSGNRAGQQLLNEFISQFALDLPEFMNGNNKEKSEYASAGDRSGDKLTSWIRRKKNSITSAERSVRSVIRRKNMQRSFRFFQRLQTS